MKRHITCLASATFALALFLSVRVIAQQPGRNLVPLAEDSLKNPSPNDWLMYNRTYDAQRFSPLQQINQSNVSQLKLACGNRSFTMRRSTPSVFATSGPAAFEQSLQAISNWAAAKHSLRQKSVEAATLRRA